MTVPPVGFAAMALQISRRSASVIPRDSASLRKACVSTTVCTSYCTPLEYGLPAGCKGGERTWCSEALEAGGGVAEAGEFYTHAVYDAQIEAAEFAVVVAGFEVVQGAAGLEFAAEAAEG